MLSKKNDKFSLAIYINVKNNKTIGNLCARNNSLNCLKYAYENGCYWDEMTCSEAVKYDSLNCLKYAHENNCPWDERTCAEAARSGRMNYLVYAHQHKCPWDAYTCMRAAGNGHLNCLIFAHGNGCTWDEWTCKEAAANEHFDCFKYFIDQMGILPFPIKLEIYDSKKQIKYLEYIKNVHQTSKRIRLN